MKSWPYSKCISTQISNDNLEEIDVTFTVKPPLNWVSKHIAKSTHHLELEQEITEKKAMKHFDKTVISKTGKLFKKTQIKADLKCKTEKLIM